MSNAREISIEVPGKSRQCTIRVGHGAMSSLGTDLKAIKPCTRAMVVSDEHVGPVYGKLVKKRLVEAGYEAFDVLIEPGEASKEIETAALIWQELAQHGFTRDDVVVACGGGVVGDLAGFVAATYMRGIDFVQVPTSLLAMVDASIGGKTAVDLSCGKNLVGAFHQPLYVCSDTRCLKTLSDDDWANGFAEAIKSAIISPHRSFYEWIKGNSDKLLDRDPIALEDLVYRTASFKASVVNEDPDETSGLRACLNYGHTLAHAIESLAGYGTIPHGRAVAEGMRFAARLSVEVLGCDPQFVAKQDALLDKMGLPEIPWTNDPEALLHVMKCDKKNRGNSLRFILVNGVADWKLQAVPVNTVLAHLEAWCTAKKRLIAKSR